MTSFRGTQRHSLRENEVKWTRGDSDGDTDESRIQAELAQTAISLTSVAGKLDTSSPESRQQPCLLPAPSDGGSLAVGTPVGLRLALLV